VCCRVYFSRGHFQVPVSTYTVCSHPRCPAKQTHKCHLEVVAAAGIAMSSPPLGTLTQGDTEVATKSLRNSHEVPAESEGRGSKTKTMAGKIGKKFMALTSIRAAAYTLCDVEKTIYDERHGNRNEPLLMESDLINVEGNDGNEDFYVSPILLRCFQDQRCVVVDVLMLLTVLGSTVVAPLTFIWGGNWNQFDQIPGGYQCLQVDMALDAAFGLYLILRLNMSFMHPHRRVEITSRWKILKRVLTSPMYWIQLLSTMTYVAIIHRGVYTIANAVKIVRLTHFVELPDSLWRFRNRAVVRVMRPVFLLVCLSHWCACLLSCIGGYREQIEEAGHDAFVTRWTGTSSNEVIISGHVSVYVMTFVEACLLLTGSFDNPLGEGSARENNFGALVMVAIMAPIGCVGVSMIIAAVVREQQLIFALEMRHQESKSFMTRALENLNIPKELRRRVYSLHYFQKMSHDNEALHALFNSNNLSPSLDSALKVYLYRDSVLYSQYFKGKNTNYILEVIRKLVDYVYLPGDYVTRRGEVGTMMFFVVRGVLTIFVPGGRQSVQSEFDSAINVGKKWKGDWFGEIALIQDSLRTAWVRADCYVILSALSRASMEEVWRYYPDQRQELYEQVVATRERDQQRKLKAEGATRDSLGSVHSQVRRGSTHTVEDNEQALRHLREHGASSVLDSQSFSQQSDKLGHLYQQLRVDQTDLQSRLHALEDYILTAQTSSQNGQNYSSGVPRLPSDECVADSLLPFKPKSFGKQWTPAVAQRRPITQGYLGSGGAV